MMTEFHFLRPWMLLLLLPVCALLLREWRRAVRFNSWQDVVDPHLLQFQLGVQSQSRQWRLLVLIFFAALLIAGALAGPAWERLPVPVFRDARARVIVLDASRSMLAADVAPSRMARARFKVRDLLARSHDVQVGLVAFAAAPYTISPLTDDTRTITALVPSISPEVVPVQGSDIAAALHEAALLMEGGGINAGQIVLFSDSQPAGKDIDAAKTLRGRGYRVSVLAIGSESGAPIPARGSFLKDTAGNIVIARVDHAGLRGLAAAGGGVFAPMSANDSDISRLLDAASTRQVGEFRRADDRYSERWVERGPWLLLPLIPLVALLFRRGVL